MQRARIPVSSSAQASAANDDSRSGDVVRISPFHFVHVLDTNKNIARIVIGPQTFTRQDHEQIIFGPSKMIIIPPMCYCVVSDPVVREGGRPLQDKYGQYVLKFGDKEIRTHNDWSEPFPLYPGEQLVGEVKKLQVVGPNQALRLVANRDITEASGEKRHAGDEWLFKGPGVYVPRIEVDVSEFLEARIIKQNQALRLRARRECVDCYGKERKSGEEWLIREAGAYLPLVFEEVLDVRNAFVLTDRVALHLRATRTFVDVYGKERKAGEEWIVSIKDAESHIQDVYEECVGTVNITILSNREYCVVLDPAGADGTIQLGKKELRKGPQAFFLRPGEVLEDGRVKTVYVLSDQEALLLKAKETLLETHDDKQVERKPGDLWMIYGPCDYVPPVEVEIVTKRTAIPLDENEGIYVRDIKTGHVRAVKNCTYMLKPNEELWEKDLPDGIEELLLFEYYRDDEKKDGARPKRDKTRIVTYRVPHNASVQVYDYKLKRSRVVFGPDLVMLNPDEQFTVVHLSGDKPKRPNVIRTLALLMGPDFMTDIVNVETSDHARLSLTLSYNWRFDVDREDTEQAAKLFSVRDFVGDACKAIASRVRGAVAAETFDNFHKHSAQIIRTAVFGRENHSLMFPANNLLITNVDIQSAEPVDQKTRESLQKSVQLAIEITTRRQQSNATHLAMQEEQQARGKLERQRISDEAQAEESRKRLKELMAQSAAVESSGQAKAEAKANAESKRIEGEAAVNLARLKAEATETQWKSELDMSLKMQEAELSFQDSMDQLQIAKSKALAAIEAEKFRAMVDSISTSTLQAIARAGPEMQAKLLQGLGLQGFLVTDGNSPINLFNTASGLISHPGQAMPSS